MRRASRPILLALLALIVAAGAPVPASGREPRVYAVWPHSDYKPWQADVYTREPDVGLRELDWMREVGINTYLPLALASGRVNWPSERFPDRRALFGARSPLDTAVHQVRVVVDLEQQVKLFGALPVDPRSLSEPSSR
jgi:hypothetical protein